MTLEEFQNLINGKIFIELTTTDAVSSFTAIDPSGEGTGEAIRSEATTAGVLVFLKTINKIFARGTYYGISAADWNNIANRVTTIETAINSMGEPLANLAGIVAGHTADIATHTKVLNGDPTVEVPEDTSAANYETLKTQHDGLISRVNAAWAAIKVIDPSGGDITGAIESLVDNRLDNVLDGRIADYLTTNDYVTETDLSNYLTTNNYLQEADVTTIRQGLTGLQTAVSNLQTDVATKADADDLSSLIGLIGADNINDAAWGKTSTMVTVVNELNNTTSTLQSTVSGLESAITGIPKFSIKVVDNLPTENIETSTIYLKKSPDAEQDTNDLFTEYIYINKNAGHEEDIDPDTQQPIGPRWEWEKLGRQVFKMDQYLDSDAVHAITDPLVSYINQIQGSITAETAGKIQQNENNIATLQTTLGSLQTTLGSLQTAVTAIQTSLAKFTDENGDFNLTGEDINTTSAQDSLTIAEEIANLSENKLDKTAITWAVL